MTFQLKSLLKCDNIHLYMDLDIHCYTKVKYDFSQTNSEYVPWNNKRSYSFSISISYRILHCFNFMYVMKYVFNIYWEIQKRSVYNLVLEITWGNNKLITLNQVHIISSYLQYLFIKPSTCINYFKTYICR